MADQRDVIRFAEKVLELLDEGRYTATYKYAVLLALIDLCLEGKQTSGAPPEMVTTRQLADKIVDIYWPHTVTFASRTQASVLRQNGGGQADSRAGRVGHPRLRYGPVTYGPGDSCSVPAGTVHEEHTGEVGAPLRLRAPCRERRSAQYLAHQLDRRSRIARGPGRGERSDPSAIAF